MGEGVTDAWSCRETIRANEDLIYKQGELELKEVQWVLNG